MLKVGQVVIDWGRGEQEHLLALAKIVEIPIARAARLGPEASIPKMVSLVHEDHVGLAPQLPEFIGVVAAIGTDAPHQIGMIIDLE